jgi:HK97 family phage portal protein
VMQVKTSDVNPSGSLSEEQFSRLRSELDNGYSGARNAHRPMLLEGGLEWKQISLSPKDMEFLSLKSTTAIDICQAFGVFL